MKGMGQIICIERPCPSWQLPSWRGGGRIRINIRWLISFRGDQGVAFLKFPANCPFTRKPFLLVCAPPLCLVTTLLAPSRRIISASRRWYPFSPFDYRIDGCERTIHQIEGTGQLVEIFRSSIARDITRDTSQNLLPQINILRDLTRNYLFQFRV